MTSYNHNNILIIHDERIKLYLHCVIPDTALIHILLCQEKKELSPLTFSFLCLGEDNFMFPTYRRCLENTQLTSQKQNIEWKIKWKNIPQSSGQMLTFSRACRCVEAKEEFRGNLHFKKTSIPGNSQYIIICFILSSYLPT